MRIFECRSIVARSKVDTLFYGFMILYFPYLVCDFFTRRENANVRDMEKEKKLESEITKLLRENFSFKFIELSGQAQRMGKTGLEGALIGTLAQCSLCQSSSEWLGRYSPKTEISGGKLWLVQHLKANPIRDNDETIILNAIKAGRTSRVE